MPFLTSPEALAPRGTGIAASVELNTGAPRETRCGVQEQHCGAGGRMTESPARRTCRSAVALLAKSVRDPVGAVAVHRHVHGTAAADRGIPRRSTGVRNAVPGTLGGAVARRQRRCRRCG